MEIISYVISSIYDVFIYDNLKCLFLIGANIMAKIIIVLAFSLDIWLGLIPSGLTLLFTVEGETLKEYSRIATILHIHR